MRYIQKNILAMKSEMILETFLLVWLITEYTPLHDLIERIELDKKWKKVVFDNLYILLTCKKCLGFSLGLILTGNIFSAIIISIMGQIYDLKIKK